MSDSLPLFRGGVLSPWKELGAYEALWIDRGATFKTLFEKLSANGGRSPSDLVPDGLADEHAEKAFGLLRQADLTRFGVSIFGSADYPKKLREARYPPDLVYYAGFWDLIHAHSVAVVGTRSPSERGEKAARDIAVGLARRGIVVASGLACGIDTAVHRATIDAGGATIAVLGTPLNRTYPSENRQLQSAIAREHLLVSQVPILRYRSQGPERNRIFFPERNVMMSAIAAATVIVEAGETSGTFVQARAALAQNRKLFILDECFKNTSIDWPRRFQSKGAIRVRGWEEVCEHLGELSAD